MEGFKRSLDYLSAWGLNDETCNTPPAAERKFLLVRLLLGKMRVMGKGT